MLVYVLAVPLLVSATIAALTVIRAWGRRVAAPTREELRRHDAYLRAWRTNRDRQAWERDLGIPAFGQRKAPAEARAEVHHAVGATAGEILCRRRPR